MRSDLRGVAPFSSAASGRYRPLQAAVGRHRPSSAGAGRHSTPKTIPPPTAGLIDVSCLPNSVEFLKCGKSCTFLSCLCICPLKTLLFGVCDVLYRQFVKIILNLANLRNPWVHPKSSILVINDSWCSIKLPNSWIVPRYPIIRVITRFGPCIRVIVPSVPWTRKSVPVTMATRRNVKETLLDPAGASDHRGETTVARSKDCRTETYEKDRHLSPNEYPARVTRGRGSATTCGSCAAPAAAVARANLRCSPHTVQAGEVPQRRTPV